jgi:hypothetical protein
MHILIWLLLLLLLLQACCASCSCTIQLMYAACIYVIICLPAAAAAGMLRFLQLLASHPWAAAPLLVDPAGDVGPAARRALQVQLLGAVLGASRINSPFNV